MLTRAVVPNDFGEQYGDSDDKPFVMVIMGSGGYVNVHGITPFEAARAKERGVPTLTSVEARGIIARGKVAR